MKLSILMKKFILILCTKLRWFSFENVCTDFIFISYLSFLFKSISIKLFGVCWMYVVCLCLCLISFDAFDKCKCGKGGKYRIAQYFAKLDTQKLFTDILFSIATTFTICCYTNKYILCPNRLKKKNKHICCSLGSITVISMPSDRVFHTKEFCYVIN